jgi:hypothetical protein
VSDHRKLAGNLCVQAREMLAHRLTKGVVPFELRAESDELLCRGQCFVRLPAPASRRASVWATAWA